MYQVLGVRLRFMTTPLSRVSDFGHIQACHGQGHMKPSICLTGAHTIQWIPWNSLIKNNAQRTTGNMTKGMNEECCLDDGNWQRLLPTYYRSKRFNHEATWPLALKETKRSTWYLLKFECGVDWGIKVNKGPHLIWGSNRKGYIWWGQTYQTPYIHTSSPGWLRGRLQPNSR